MLCLLSPAKTLDYATPVPQAWMDQATRPVFLKEAEVLIRSLRRKSARSVATLMDLSPTLAELNVERYRAWQADHSPVNARPAAWAFDGDVYEGLQAQAMGPAQWQWMQTHLGILSGLYGCLRPLDLLQPYRLEMGTALAVGGARNLYGYWGEKVAQHLATRLDALEGERVVVNLASQEYFKVVKPAALRARLVHCHFEEWQGGRYKIISFFAKRARGLMVRYAAQHGLQRCDELRSFAEEGYAWDAAASSADEWVFRRRQAQAAAA